MNRAKRAFVKFGPVRRAPDGPPRCTIIVGGKKASYLVFSRGLGAWMCQPINGMQQLVNPQDRWPTLKTAKEAVRLGMEKWLRENENG